MRIFLLLVVLVAGAGAFWWISQQDPSVERARLEASARAASAKIGMQKMLRASDVFQFTNVVVSVSQAEDGALEFRAMVIQQGAPRPVYGQAAPNCEDTLESADCWDLTVLEVDGRPYALTESALEETESASETAAPEETTSQGASSDDSAELDVEGTTAVTPAADEEPAQAVPIQSEDAAIELPVVSETSPDAGERPGPAATHEVARPRINARAGPSTSTAILTTLSGGTPLAQITAADGWGQFLVLSGEAEGTTVWIALSIVTPVES